MPQSIRPATKWIGIVGGKTYKTECFKILSNSKGQWQGHIYSEYCGHNHADHSGHNHTDKSG